MRDWTRYLPFDVKNGAGDGAGYVEILKQFKRSYNDSYDLVIVGWSGATRDDYLEFSITTDESIEHFKDKSLDDILNRWHEHIDEIVNTAKCPVIHFSVFGDVPGKHYDNFLETSFLEYLANQDGIYFKYNIPLFEFDWLNENNFKVTGPFGKKYFPKNWKRACVEREAVRDQGSFLYCGHPNQRGHKLWAKFMEMEIDCLFAK